MEQGMEIVKVNPYTNTGVRRFCPYCGQQNDPGAGYCIRCGQRIGFPSGRHTETREKTSAASAETARREQARLFIDSYASKSVLFGVLSIVFTSTAGFIAMILAFCYANKANRLADEIGVERPGKAVAGKLLAWLYIILVIVLLIVIFKYVSPKYRF